MVSYPCMCLCVLLLMDLEPTDNNIHYTSAMAACTLNDTDDTAPTQCRNMAFCVVSCLKCQQFLLRYIL
jgi:hypothetical protein